MSTTEPVPPEPTKEEPVAAPQAEEASAAMQDVTAANDTSSLQTYNIFVGDLAPTITEAQLKDHFSQYGEIKLVNIIRDKITGACKGYAFIHFLGKEARDLALLPDNLTPTIAGQVAKVKPSDEKTTLLVSNVPSYLAADALKGELLALLVGVAKDMRVELKTPGNAMLTFATFDIANMAKKSLMNAPLQGKQISATWADAGVKLTTAHNTNNASAPPGSGQDVNVTTLHVSNIAMAANEDDLKTFFGRFGEVTRPVIVKNQLGEKRGFGFVTLPDREKCMAAMRELDQSEFFGQRIGVALAKATSGSATSTMGGTKSRPPPSNSYPSRGGPDRFGRGDRDYRRDDRDRDFGRDREPHREPHRDRPERPRYDERRGPERSHPYGGGGPSSHPPAASAAPSAAPPYSPPPPYGYPPYGYPPMGWYPYPPGGDPNYPQVPPPGGAPPGAGAAPYAYPPPYDPNMYYGQPPPATNSQPPRYY